MNMRLLKPSRKKVRAGDIFVLQVREPYYIFGRVISTDTRIGGFEGDVILLYIYNAFSTRKEPIPLLDKSNLLVPPLGTNRQPWLNGYFETVANFELRKEDVLPLHCFRDFRPGWYFDELGNRLPERVEPCGEYGLQSYRTIDDAISKALGILVAPE